MSFTLTDDQLAFRDSVRAFLQETVTVESLRKRVAGKIFFDADWNKRLKELALAHFFSGEDPEASGGIQELSLFAFEVGRTAAPENLSDAMFALYVISSVKDILIKAGFNLSNVFSGDERIALTVSQNADEGMRFENVMGIPPGSWLLAFAVDGGVSFSSLSEKSINVEPIQGFDLTNALAKVDLTHSKVVQIADHIDSAIVLLNCKIVKAHELSGLAARVVEMTTEYVRTRKQFGVPVGGFQAVQHQLADMHLQAEASRALCAFAAWSAVNSPEDYALAALSALRYAAEVVPSIIETAIQLHGGIGFTWEFELHFFLRRAIAIKTLYSSENDDSILEAAKLG